MWRNRARHVLAAPLRRVHTQVWWRTAGWSSNGLSRCRAFPAPRPSFARQVRLFSGSVTKVPELGDSITEGTVIELHKAVGDAVAVDDIILTIETDKVTVEVRSTEAGTLAEVFSGVNDDVQVGANLFRISTDGSVAPSTSSSSSSSKDSKADATAPSTSSPPPAPAAAASPPPAAAAPSSPSPASTASSAHAHVPLIQFRYGVRDAVSSATAPKKTSSPQFDFPTIKATPLPKSTSEKITELDAMPDDLLRRSLTDLEIELIETGGAVAFD